MRTVTVVLSGLLLLAPPAAHSAPPIPEGAREWIWEGEHRIEEFLEIPAHVTLQLRPGTILRFPFADRDGDGYGDNGLHVLGSIVATGTAEDPVVFTSAEREPKAGDWQGFLLDDSKGNLFEGVTLEYARHGLHTHFSEGRIIRSRIVRNIEGTRLGDTEFEIAWSLIADNESKGLNFRSCANHIHHNTITRNGHGIFLFETDTKTVIEQNNIVGNEGYAVRLGDFYEGGLNLQANWWGTSDPAQIRTMIYEGDEPSTTGRVKISPAAEAVENGW